MLMGFEFWGVVGGRGEWGWLRSCFLFVWFSGRI